MTNVTSHTRSRGRPPTAAAGGTPSARHLRDPNPLKSRRHRAARTLRPLAHEPYAPKRISALMM